METVLEDNKSSSNFEHVDTSTSAPAAFGDCDNHAEAIEATPSETTPLAVVVHSVNAVPSSIAQSAAEEVPDDEELDEDIDADLLEKPKRPLSAYNLFFREERKEILATRPVRPEGVPLRRGHGKCGFSEMAKTIAAKWKVIDQPSKKKYDLQARQEKIKYKKKVAEWRELVKPVEKKKKKQQQMKSKSLPEVSRSQVPQESASVQDFQTHNARFSMSAIDNHAWNVAPQQGIPNASFYFPNNSYHPETSHSADAARLIMNQLLSSCIAPSMMNQAFQGIPQVTMDASSPLPPMNVSTIASAAASSPSLCQPRSQQFDNSQQFSRFQMNAFLPSQQYENCNSGMSSSHMRSAEDMGDNSSPLDPSPLRKFVVDTSNAVCQEKEQQRCFSMDACAQEAIHDFLASEQNSPYMTTIDENKDYNDQTKPRQPDRRLFSSASQTSSLSSSFPLPALPSNRKSDGEQSDSSASAWSKGIQNVNENSTKVFQNEESKPGRGISGPSTALGGIDRLTGQIDQKSLDYFVNMFQG